MNKFIYNGKSQAEILDKIIQFLEKNKVWITTIDFKKETENNYVATFFYSTT
jgi:hypothetical protein